MWIRISVLLVCTSAMASAQELRERPQPFTSETSPNPGFRSPDDSDPEMQAYLREHHPGPCGTGEYCEKLREFYTAPGERLTRYLIRQYEESVDGGYVSGPHYLVRIGKTRTDLAARYLLGELSHPREPRARIAAMTALSYVNDPRVIDAAVGVLDDPTSSVRLRTIATTAIRRNMESLNWASSVGLRRLEEVEQDDGLPLSLRRTAYRNLNRLEEKGIAKRNAAPPADLEAWWNEVEARREAATQRRLQAR